MCFDTVTWTAVLPTDQSCISLFVMVLSPRSEVYHRHHVRGKDSWMKKSFIEDIFPLSPVLAAQRTASRLAMVR